MYNTAKIVANDLIIERGGLINKYQSLIKDLAVHVLKKDSYIDVSLLEIDGTKFDSIWLTVDGEVELGIYLGESYRVPLKRFNECSLSLITDILLKEVEQLDK